ncbi:thermonuclease family protein [Jiella endophytica]|uniref:Thermonuclease family protein n=1 Tax=Jiella endophytica TaxID=2558362 RepID=A0A4Y8RKW1_9HYPH|nr:thermonuclease family protein [Jiella endophytica]TFF22900.1 thermonuclease family protein [Jiella endophytica]
MRQARSNIRRSRADGWNADVAPLRAARQDRFERQRPARGGFGVILAASCALAFATPFVADWLSRQDIPALGDLVRLSPARAAVPEHRGPIGICSGPNRAARRVTCIVDGDTGWLDGEKWRMADIDTPEISSPACSREQRVGRQARDRLRSLMSAGYSLRRQGTGHYGRTIVSVTVADGRDAGAVLLDEGLAQRWPNSGNPWCL